VVAAPPCRKVPEGSDPSTLAWPSPTPSSATTTSSATSPSDSTITLGVIEALDAAVGPVKQRDRGFGAGELLTGIAAAQLAGEDFLTGLDRQRADAAGQQITPRR
jgi:hypothetical protein